MGKKSQNTELIKYPLSTTIPKLYLNALEKEVAESKGRLNLALLARMILMDYVEKRK